MELEFRNVSFWREGKSGVPGEKPLGARTITNNKPNPHMTPSSGIEPGPHWWEAEALTTAPSLRKVYYFVTHLLSLNASTLMEVWRRKCEGQRYSEWARIIRDEVDSCGPSKIEILKGACLLFEQLGPEFYPICGKRRQERRTIPW